MKKIISSYNILECSLNIRFNWVFVVMLIFISVKERSYAQSSVNRTLIEVNPPDVPTTRSLTAIVGGRLIDGLGNPVNERSVVIIEGNRIVHVGNSDTNIPEGAEIVDAQGMTILPGLIDAHLHTVNDNKTLNMFLSNGVTTMRDPGHPFNFYQSIHFATEFLPRIFLTGPHLDAFPGVYTQQATMVKDYDHINRTIRDYVQLGGTGIKIYFRLPLKYYETVLNAANYHQIPVVAHMELVAADDAIRAGLRGIEHVTSFGTSLADPKDAEEFRRGVEKDNSYRSDGRYLLWSKIDLGSDRVKQVLELAAKENVVLCPTLTTFERQKGDDSVKDFQAEGFSKMLQFVGMAHKAGVKIVTGSHTSGKYAKTGWAYQREMELLVEAGMTPLEVISSSTINNAHYFRSSERIGSIEAGKLADLILIKGNPAVDISHMYNIHKVMLNGKWVDK